MSSAAQNTIFDVAIIGLGPVGSLGAILCAEAGLKVVVVEQQVAVRFYLHLEYLELHSYVRSHQPNRYQLSCEALSPFC